MKTVIITGVSKGLGQHTAGVFLKAGWQVIGTGRSARPAGLDQAIDYHKFDASDAAAGADFWKQLQLDDEQICLVNNAGGYLGGSLLEAKPEDFARQMQSNFFAGVYMTKGLIGHVAKARIINLISNNAQTVVANNSAYSASKAAAKQFFQTIQKEFPAEKYQITNLYPVSIATSGPDPNAIDPDDLAAFILELAESQTSYNPADITLAPVKRS